MARKKKSTSVDDDQLILKPHLKIVKGKVDAGKEPRRIDDAFFDLPEWDALNEDERRFVEEYIIDRNGTRAFFRAGLRSKSYGGGAVQAHFYLKRLNVAAAVKKAHEMLTQAVQEDLTSIAANFQMIRDKSLREVPVLDHEGNPTGEYTFQANAAIAANKELGLALGVLRHKMEVTGKDGKPIEHSVRVEGQITITLEDLTRLSLPVRKEILRMLEEKEAMGVNGNGNGAH